MQLKDTREIFFFVSLFDHLFVRMSSSSKTSKDLLHRLMIMEKFIELKSNECAYYRSKVHLMQINPLSIPMITTSPVKHEHKPRKSISYASQEEFTSNSTSRSTSVDDRERKFIPPKTTKNIDLPFDRSKKMKSPLFASPVRRYRKDPMKKTRSISAQNQNYADDVPYQEENSPLSSYAKKHLQTVLVFHSDRMSSDWIEHFLVSLPAKRKAFNVMRKICLQ